jgi:hypothetical protein
LDYVVEKKDVTIRAIGVDGKPYEWTHHYEFTTNEETMDKIDKNNIDKIYKLVEAAVEAKFKKSFEDVVLAWLEKHGERLLDKFYDEKYPLDNETVTKAIAESINFHELEKIIASLFVERFVSRGLGHES